MKTYRHEQKYLILAKCHRAPVHRLRTAAGIYVADLNVGMDVLGHGIEARIAPEKEQVRHGPTITLSQIGIKIPWTAIDALVHLEHPTTINHR